MKVHVLKNAPISTLFSLLPNGRKTVFFDGLVIDHHKTFSELGIESFSRFVILDGENISSNQMCFWKKVTLRDDESREQFQLIGDMMLKKEFSRICDLKLMHLENRSYHIKRMIKNNSVFNVEQNEEQSISTIKDFERTMNGTPLPILW
jgi:hypothetical protein